MAIHDFVPAAVPAPVPTTNVARSRATEATYRNGVSHSRSRYGTRKMTAAPTTPIAIQIIWRCQIPAAMVGKSVCPAEYNVAIPGRIRAATASSSGLSIPVRRITYLRTRWSAESGSTTADAGTESDGSTHVTGRPRSASGPNKCRAMI